MKNITMLFKQALSSGVRRSETRVRAIHGEFRGGLGTLV